MTDSFSAPLVILVVIVNVLWFTVKSILSDNGYKVNYFSGHFRDIPNFRRLIKSTENNVQKSKYNRIFWSLIISVIVFVGLAILSFVNFNN